MIYDTVSRGGKTWEDGRQPSMPRCPPRQIDVAEQTGFFGRQQLALCVAHGNMTAMVCNGLPAL